MSKTYIVIVFKKLSFEDYSSKHQRLSDLLLPNYMPDGWFLLSTQFLKTDT